MRDRHSYEAELPENTASAEGVRAHQMRQDAGVEAPGRTDALSDGVLVQVCMECGKEYIFDDEPPPENLCCEKCGNKVFRSFFEVRVQDEVEADYRASTERDLAPDDPESDVTRSDLLDLNNP